MTTKGMCRTSMYCKAQLQIAKQLSAFADRVHDGAEIVVQQYDRCHFARAARRAFTHRDADIGCLKSGHVVHPPFPVTATISPACCSARTRASSGWGCPGNDVDVAQVCDFTPRERCFELLARDHRWRFRAEADFQRDRGRGEWVVAGDHDGVNSGHPALRWRRPTTPSRSGSSNARSPAMSYASGGSCICLVDHRGGRVTRTQSLCARTFASVATCSDHCSRSSGVARTMARKTSAAPFVTARRAAGRVSDDGRLTPARLGEWKCGQSGAGPCNCTVGDQASENTAASMGLPLSRREAICRQRQEDGHRSCPRRLFRCVTSAAAPSVIVPVLSEQIVVTRPMFSTETAR